MISSPSFEVALWIRGRLPCDGFDYADLTSWKVTLCACRTASPDISAIRLPADASGVALPSPWYSSPVQGRSLSSALGSVLPRAICVAGHGMICPPLPHCQTCQELNTLFTRLRVRSLSAGIFHVVYRNFLGSGAASDRTNAVRNSLTRSAGHHRMPPTS